MVLLSLWGLCPIALWFEPTFFGLFPSGNVEFTRHLGMLWLALGFGALLFRTVQLCIQQSPLTGVVWFSKIATDPFHDIKLYFRAPLYVLRGELMDPMADVVHRA